MACLVAGGVLDSPPTRKSEEPRVNTKQRRGRGYILCYSSARVIWVGEPPESPANATHAGAPLVEIPPASPCFLPVDRRFLLGGQYAATASTSKLNCRFVAVAPQQNRVGAVSKPASSRCELSRKHRRFGAPAVPECQLRYSGERFLCESGLKFHPFEIYLKLPIDESAGDA